MQFMAEFDWQSGVTEKILGDTILASPIADLDG